MSVHAYPARALWGDYLRALAGTLSCLLILAAVPLAPPAAAVTGGLAAVFAAFGLRTGLRHRTRLEMSERALCVAGPRGAQIPWAALDGMRLSYYALRRDGEGWMQLMLRAGPARISLDSRIEGFAALVERAARAAAARRLPLNAATLANLEALGLRPAEPPAAALRAAGERA
jgi:hypothetical protein